MTDKVRFEDRGAVRILRINRPEQRNCVDGETAVGIGRSIEAFAGDTNARVLIVTGRMFQSVRPYARAAGIDDPVICYQGAVVADPTTGEFLRHEPIPLDAALEVIAAVEETGYPLNCYVGDELYVASAGPEAERYASFQNLRIHEVDDLATWLTEEPTKLVVVGDSEALDELGPVMRAAGKRE